ncbi:hypothetical protein THIARS_40157 [Thiomonas delicata]|uniref:Uncharacterized protein n=1 Tax=Thiomonas delicata TaxID=364030 RepID=A0A238CZV3_THIDL|nr:hypothetical protein THIARS_40157 [Thiomonas delicata]
MHLYMHLRLHQNFVNVLFLWLRSRL